MLECRVTDTPMEANVKLLSDYVEILDYSRRYQRLVSKLNYLTIIRPDLHLLRVL